MIVFCTGICGEKHSIGDRPESIHVQRMMQSLQLFGVVERLRFNPMRLDYPQAIHEQRRI